MKLITLMSLAAFLSISGANAQSKLHPTDPMPSSGAAPCPTTWHSQPFASKTYQKVGNAMKLDRCIYSGMILSSACTSGAGTISGAWCTKVPETFVGGTFTLAIPVEMEVAFAGAPCPQTWLGRSFDKKSFKAVGNSEKLKCVYSGAIKGADCSAGGGSVVSTTTGSVSSVTCEKPSGSFFLSIPLQMIR